MKARFFRNLVALAILLSASAAHGQALDTAEIQKRGADAEITIRFVTQLLYLRHCPPEEGSSVRIYLRLTGGRTGELEQLPGTRILPALGPAPAANIRFPESDNSLSVTFDKSTRYSVRPGADGRSIVLLIPAKPESATDSKKP
ncbi:MAG: hypothetical protein IH606_15075 [Burkholderiales bacterium]|nr:hypothetical protein [Burkholderiales bacterium]